MTPYGELHAHGWLDDAGYNLLFELTRQELRRCPFCGPRPAGDDAVWDAVVDFLIERGWV